MVDRNSLLKIASKLKTKIRIDEMSAQWRKEAVPKMLSKEETKERDKAINQNRKKLAKVMARIDKMFDKKASSKRTAKQIQSQQSRSVGGGRAAAAIDSGRGGVAKSLMTRKLTPKT